MGPFVLAWLTGETIIVYRSAKTYKAPPGPGQLLLSSGLFGILSLIAESQKGRTPATIMAWGINVAAFMNLYPSATTKIGQGIGAALGAVTAPGSGQSWPPPIAANNVVIPNGTTADSQSGSSTAAPTVPFTPNLTE